MKITTEPQSIYVKAFDQTYNFGTVWLNADGVICFSAGPSGQSKHMQFPGGICFFLKHIRRERDSIRTQLTTFANKVSR